MSEPAMWCPECGTLAMPVCDIRNHVVIDLVAERERLLALLDERFGEIARQKARIEELEWLGRNLGALEAERE